MAQAPDSHLFTTYAPAPQRFVRGEGVWLIDETGERYLDFSGGVAVNVLGHAHPHLVGALKAQAESLWHTSNLFQIPDRERLAGRLCAASFADRAFFTNSGAEAIECAIKTARRYHHARGQPGRFRIITFEGAFHGRTLAAIAAGGQAKYMEGFGPKVAGFDQLAFGDHEAVKALDFSDIAAILIEPIQGEGGIRAVPHQCLQGLRDLCDRTGTLLILDEIQTGIGRTGHFFAHEAAGMVPDILASAKGIGGGFPLGVCLATEEAASGMMPGSHGSTYGGNALAMAVGNAVLDVVLGEGFLDNVRAVANQFRQGLASLIDTWPDVIAEMRGEGLLVGLKCRRDNLALINALRDRHMLAVAAGDNVVRLLPPLNITPQEASLALSKLDAACKAVSLKV